MTAQTLPVGGTTHHTEQTLKARVSEARAIKDAWAHRLNLAHRKLRSATVSGYGLEVARGELRVVEIEFEDAAAALSGALVGWEAVVRLVRVRGGAGVRSGQRGPGGVIGRV